MRFAPLLALSWPMLAVSLLTACGGGESTRLEIELAPTFPAGGATGDRQCSAPGGASESELDCVTVTVCRREGAGCVPVRVLRASDDHAGVRTTELRFSRGEADNKIQFDADLAPGEEHELEIRAYADNLPNARGRVEGVRAGDALVRVRLEPYGKWSCAGPRADGDGPLARALHQTVALPNGDALVIGGVTGENVQISIDGGAVLQRAIEVYDASEARFYELEVGGIESGGFGVVFHHAYYLDTTDGRHRVRVVGGFTSADVPGARFDAQQGLTRYGSPLLPGAGAEVRDSVDLVYDPVARTIEVLLVNPGALPRGGMNAVSEPDDDGLVVVSLGLLDFAFPPVRPPAPVLAGQWYPLPASLVPMPMPMLEARSMLTPRFGHTASRMSDDTVLLWGGNVTRSTTEDVAATAGELLRAGAEPSAIPIPIPASVAGLPPATAFHTATPIEGGVLIAGGMAVTPFSSVSGGVSTIASTQPLTVVSLDATNTAFGTPVAIDPAAWPTPILHAATELADGSVLITGGARRLTPAAEGASETHLWAIDSVIRVSRDATGVYTATPLPSMIGARWGHQATLLPGDRVLVTGGFAREPVMRGEVITYPLRAISSAEMILLATPPEAIVGCNGEESDGGTVRRDAGPSSVDAGVEPDASMSSDAGAADGAVTPAVDAGI